MIDWEYFTWRSITEFIRHITFVFVIALIIAVFPLHTSILEMIERALNPTNISNIFCAILIFSVPLYLICAIIDSIDSVLISKKGGYATPGFIGDLLGRVVYDATYIIFYFRNYIVVFLLLVIISAIGLIFLL